MIKWNKIIEENHCGHNDPADYTELVKENSMTEVDLDYFDQVINNAMSGGTLDYDSFSGNGGIDIAAALLAEVWRCRKLLKTTK